MRRVILGSLAFAASLSVAAVTHAHIQLTYPAQRHSDQKVGPCGVLNDARGDTVTTIEPGATIEVTWDETINHPGHYRIMFLQDGFAFPDPTDYTDFCEPGTDEGCLLDNIEDKDLGAYSATVTLPNVECDNCTLQVIQIMTDKPPWGPGGGNDIYYQCADIALKAGGGEGGGSATSTSTVSGSGGGTGGGATSGTTGTGGDPGSGGAGGAGGEGDEGGCDCRMAGGQGNGPAAAALAALALLSLAARRRRG